MSLGKTFYIRVHVNILKKYVWVNFEQSCDAACSELAQECKYLIGEMETEMETYFFRIYPPDTDSFFFRHHLHYFRQ